MQQSSFEATKKFSKICGTVWITTISMNVHHWVISIASWLQSTPWRDVSLESILILSFHYRLWLQALYLVQVFRTKSCTHFSSHAIYPAHAIILNLIKILARSTKHIADLIDGRPYEAASKLGMQTTSQLRTASEETNKMYEVCPESKDTSRVGR